MDEKDDTMPFPREPWQRLLADGDGPPETTDARIRAAARRDLAPRGRRWWLPASLAASLVLAVFVVQSQFGTVRVPIMIDMDRGEGGAINARLAERENAEAARPPGEAAAAASDAAKRPADAAPTDAYGYPDAEIAADSAGAGPRIGGPERDVQAAHESPDDRAYPESSADSGVPQPDPPPSETPVAASAPAAEENFDQGVAPRAEARRADSAQDPPATSRIRPPPYERSPEAWYAYIEKLRARGQTEEADRQLVRLEKAHPGWVERYLRDHPQP